jgi:hypothetical protein
MNRQSRMRDPELIALPKKSSFSTEVTHGEARLSRPHHPKTAWVVNLCEWGNTPSQKEGRNPACPKANKVSLA